MSMFADRNSPMVMANTPRFQREQKWIAFFDAVEERRKKAALPVPARCLCIGQTAYHQSYSGPWPAKVYEGYAPAGGASIEVASREELEQLEVLARDRGLLFNDPAV